mgnify:FL=1
MALTARKAAFVAEYPKDLNATQAAIRAGYSEHTAYSQGSRLLKDVEVQQALQQVSATAGQRVEQHLGQATVTVERVVQEYARIAFADMRRFASVSAGGITLKSSEEWTDDDAAVVAELGETVSKDGGSIRFKLHSKVAALDSLAKHLGMFGDDPRKDGDRHLHLHGLTDDQLRALASGFST